MASTFHQIIVRYNLCTDKSSFKVCVDFTCCLRCFCSFCNRPCTDFRIAGCQIADQSEQFVAGFEQFFQSGEFCKGSIFEIVFKESGDGSTGNDNEGDAIYQTLYCNSPLMWATEAILESMFGTDPRRRSMVGQKESAPDLEMLDCGPHQKLT